MTKQVYDCHRIMNYVEIVNLVFFSISILVNIYLFHFVFFMIVGVVHRKTFPQAAEQCRYGILVSAKDEENVIPRLIHSIQEADYPKDKIDIYVIAHNCKDKTAEVARSLGVHVIVYDDENARTLGLAYQYAFKRINIKEYDGFIIFNADNVVRKDYFQKLNDAFVYYQKDAVVTTFRHALNIADGTMPAIYSYYFASSCLLCYIGRECLNVSTRVTGCGFVVPVRLLENGWNYTSITEDIEFSVDRILDGETFHYCDEAIFYDEQPCSFVPMWFQRLRWAKGQNLTSRKYFPKLFKALFDRKKKNKFSIYTAMTFNSFIPLLYFFLSLLQNLILLFAPCAGISLQEAFLYWNQEQNWFQNLFLSFSTGAVFGIIKGLIWFFLASYLTTFMVLLASRGKYKGQPKLPLIKGFLLFPLFVLLQVPLDITALLVRDVKWRKIPHGVNKKKR